jgi:hypothetical protein
MKKLWPLRTFHGPFPVGRDLLTCSTEYTLPVCFGCALASGMVSICFILLVRVIAASRREATFRHRHRRELRMNEGRCLRRRHTSSTTRGYEASQNTAQRKSRCEALAGDGEAFGIEPIKPGLLGLRGRKIALGRRLEGSYRD